jgi:hypothetical protein
MSCRFSSTFRAFATSLPTSVFWALQTNKRAVVAADFTAGKLSGRKAGKFGGTKELTTK